MCPQHNKRIPADVGEEEQFLYSFADYCQSGDTGKCTDIHEWENEARTGGLKMHQWLSKQYPYNDRKNEDEHLFFQVEILIQQPYPSHPFSSI